MKWNLIIYIFCVIVPFLSIAFAHDHHGHSHGSHGHSDEHHHMEHDRDPKFKYTREANEKFNKEKVKDTHHHDTHHHHHHHEHSHDGHTKEIPRDNYDIWLHSIGSTLLISAAPFFILYFVPLDNTEKMQPRLKTLLAFASGGLLGDAFLHLIPHATTPHDGNSHSHSHSHNHHDHDEAHDHSHDMWVGLWVLGGIITFLAVEKLVRILKIGHDHSHGHSHTTTKVVPKEKTEKKDNKEAVKLKKDNKGEKSAKVTKKEEKSSMEVAGYLNLAADFTHNFTDGLAIGASYLAGNSIGIVTTLTILLHEVPHEIGDFAILIKSGCSKKKAMLLQLTTAVGALAGNVLALIGNNGADSSPKWILPFTAGGFIYIATVSVIPELLEQSTKLGQSLKEIFALLAGVGMMILITLFE